MKIKLIAIALADGWGFISEDNKKFLLRPPYTSEDKIELPRDLAGEMIARGAYEVCDIDFDNKKDLVRHLKDVYIESKQGQGVSPSSSEKRAEFLKYATDDILFGYLTRARDELIPEEQYDAAAAVALDLMKLERVRENAKMWEIGLDILEKCRYGDRERW